MTRLAVVGLGFGDEGKGSIIDALVRRAQSAHGGPLAVSVVRHNGGPQAAHHVVTATGQSHCFAQLGAGSLCPTADSWLSPHMLIEPLALKKEAAALATLTAGEPLRTLHIDERCVVVTPFHKLLNRMQELGRGGDRHGSCGLGVGQAWLDSRNRSLPSLRIGEATDRGQLMQKLRFLQLVKIDQAEQLVDSRPDLPALADCLHQLKRRDWLPQLSDSYAQLLNDIAGLDDGSRLAKRLRGDGPLLFEGAQGLLLDAERGFFPHVTPSCTGWENADQLCAAAQVDRPRRIGVLRAYATRHGAGPLPSRDPLLESQLPEPHNLSNPWQGPMRVGWFDAVLADYALAAAGGVDGLALTCLDRLAGRDAVQVCIGYRLAKAAAELLPLPLAQLAELSDDNGSLQLHRLRRPPIPSRDHQAALTQLLSQVQPIYQQLPGWPHGAVTSSGALVHTAADFVAYLESRLAIPIDILSHGPTATDKRFRSHS